jgi:hypothetical protein
MRRQTGTGIKERVGEEAKLTILFGRDPNSSTTEAEPRQQAALDDEKGGQKYKEMEATNRDGCWI